MRCERTQLRVLVNGLLAADLEAGRLLGVQVFGGSVTGHVCGHGAGRVCVQLCILGGGGKEVVVEGEPWGVLAGGQREHGASSMVVSGAIIHRNLWACCALSGRWLKQRWPGFEGPSRFQNWRV